MAYYKVTYNPPLHRTYIVVAAMVAAKSKWHAIALTRQTEAATDYQDQKLYKAKLLK